jgi:hypothetical protein
MLIAELQECWLTQRVISSGGTSTFFGVVFEGDGFILKMDIFPDKSYGFYLAGEGLPKARSGIPFGEETFDEVVASSPQVCCCLSFCKHSFSIRCLCLSITWSDTPIIFLLFLLVLVFFSFVGGGCASRGPGAVASV